MMPAPAAAIWDGAAIRQVLRRAHRETAALGPDCVKTRKLSGNGALGANFFPPPSL